MPTTAQRGRLRPGVWALLLGPALLVAAAAAGDPTGYNFAGLSVAGGPGNDQASAVAADGTGGVRVVGAFEATASFGSTNLVAAGSTDGFLAAYDATGDLRWVRVMGGTGQDSASAVAVDGAGRTAVAGYFRANLDLGSLTLTNRGGMDGFVALYDAGGTVVWARVLGGAGEDRAVAVACDAAGEVYVAGHFLGTAQFGETNLSSYGLLDVYVARISPEGAVRWVAQAGGPSTDEPFGLAVDPDGRSFVVGSVAGTNVFGSVLLTNALETQLFTAACSPDGEFLWAQSGGSGRADRASAVAVGSGGEVTVVGQLGGPAVLGDLQLTNAALTYTFTARYTAEGALTWLVAHGGQEARAVMADPAGRATVAGAFNGTNVFGGIPLRSVGALDWFVMQHDSGGDVDWARSAGGTNMDYAYGLTRWEGPALALVGRGTTNATFDTWVAANARAFDLLVTRLTPAPVLQAWPGDLITNAGAAVTLEVEAVGAEPLDYQWYVGESVPVGGGTNAWLPLTNLASANSGSYWVEVSNAFGTVSSPPAQLTVLGLAPPFVSVNGATGTNLAWVDLAEVTVTLESAFPGASLYYTLDGSQPTFGSPVYGQPFPVRQSAVVRAIAYSPQLESAEAEPVHISLSLSPPVIEVEGQTGSDLRFTNQFPVTVVLRAGLPEAAIHYTTDGSEPSVGSPLYEGPWSLSESATLRAMATTPELGAALAGPVAAQLFRTYQVTVSPNPDGTVMLSPPGGVYLEGTAIVAAAEPTAPWAFLGWTGDAAGTNATVQLLVERDLTLGAEYGTTVSTLSQGGGSIRLSPVQALYPRGARLQAVALPEPGQFFAQWSGAASGTNNPMSFTVAGPKPVVVAAFSPLPPGHFTLTVVPNGDGGVDVAPAANFYTNLTAVTVTAQPDPGARFLRWTGDVESGEAQLLLQMTTNRLLTANFTGAGFMLLEAPNLAPTGEFEFRLLSDPGLPVELQTSTHLGAVPAWEIADTLTNSTGEDVIRQPVLPGDGPVLYRAVRPSGPAPAGE